VARATARTRRSMLRVSSPGRRLQEKALQFVADSVSDLRNQNTPFGRLALTHVLSTAGDTLVTISLAGSLFFSISPEAAKSKVILYLLLTAAPFAVVAPFMGPVIDRSRGARRALVVASAGLRAFMCIFMAQDIKSLLLFPEAFTMLVLSKVYLVTKGSLVPILASREPMDQGARNGDAGAQPGAGHTPGPPAELAVLNARLGLLASLAGFAAALPAVLILKLGGGEWVLYVDILVLIAAAIAGSRLPIGKGARYGSAAPRDVDTAGPTSGIRPPGGWNDPSEVPKAHPTPASKGWDQRSGDPPPSGWDTDEDWEPATPLQALRSNTHPEVMLAASAMSLLRGLVGFVTFLLAFELRRQHAAPIWFGFMLGASTVGAVVGVLLVPRLRKMVGDAQVLVLSVWSVAIGGLIAAVVGGRVIQGLLALLLGIAGAAGKPAFDALVQRYVRPAAQGRAFARFETRLQLVWVIGGLIPVIATMPFDAGDIVTAAVAAVAAVSYMTGRRALHHRMTEGY
jgi:Major Facilitator Superfamily